MNYTKKSFSVAMGNPSSSFADRWEATFGKKSAEAAHREGCLGAKDGAHCALCGWCELPGDGSCVCYAR